MLARDKLLAWKTFKQAGLDLDRRVFYTLVGEQETPHQEQPQTDRNSKALGFLFKALRKSCLLTDNQVDAILLDVVS
jgi:hypothetical protein